MSSTGVFKTAHFPTVLASVWTKGILNKVEGILDFKRKIFFQCLAISLYV